MSVNLQRDTARLWLADALPAVVVDVIEAKGSAPRDAGTRMLVSAAGAAGTIGGGHLELKALEQARAMLASAAPVATQQVHYPLGPSLGQCCGGAVTLRFERLSPHHLDTWPTTPPRFVL